jgi:hypothetical protein
MRLPGISLFRPSALRAVPAIIAATSSKKKQAMQRAVSTPLTFGFAASQISE